MLRVNSANLNYNYITDTYDTIWTHKNISVDDNVLFDMDATEEIFGFGTEDNYGDAVLFTDERINGQSHTITFDFWTSKLGIGQSMLRCTLSVATSTSTRKALRQPLN